mmetsp:Transcript_10107/g.24139  ORF Transcript_10107/g.24139 Transcript_10107/m.24139 type:complete len:356 (+) Transcript_10107:168-1235(+)
MSQQNIQGALTLSALGFSVTIISLFLPFYEIVISTSPFGHAGTVDLYAAGIHTYVRDKTLCKALEAPKIDPEFCYVITGAQNLRDVVRGFCLPAAQVLANGACEGTWFANAIGMVIVAAILTNVILEGMSVYLLYEYVTRAPIERKRTLANTLQAVKLFVIAVPLLFYLQLAIMQLDDVAGNSSESTLVFSISRDGGMGKGYGGMWIGFCFQLVSAVMTCQSGPSAEERLAEEAQEEGRSALEMRTFNAQVPRSQGSQSGMQSSPPHFNAPPQPPGAPRGSITGHTAEEAGEMPFMQRRSTGVPVPFEKRSSFTVGSPGGGAASLVPTRPTPEGWGAPWEAESAPQGAPQAGTGT